MNKKRILIIEDQQQLSGLCPDSECQLFVTYEPQQALSLLMGGGMLLKSNYSGEKVRPDLLLMHASFFHQSCGVEFLELIKKYYSLKSIKVYLYGDLQLAPDAATLSKYNIINYLELPLTLEHLSELIDESAEKEMNINNKFWGVPALFFEEHIKPFISQVGGQKTMLVNSGKALVKTKLFYGGMSAVAVASAVSIPSDPQNEEKHPVTNIVEVAKMPEQKQAPALVVDSFPKIEETAIVPLVRKNIAPEPVVEAEPTIDTSHVISVRQNFKIQIVPDSTEFSADF